MDPSIVAELNRIVSQQQSCHKGNGISKNDHHHQDDNSYHILKQLLQNKAVSIETIQSAYQNIVEENKNGPTTTSQASKEDDVVVTKPNEKKDNVMMETTLDNSTLSSSSSVVAGTKKESHCTAGTKRENIETTTTTTTTTTGDHHKNTLSSLYRTRHIAFHVYYKGNEYNGLAQNIGDERDHSIEKHIFAALMKTKLITSRDACQYSRCGRTDKGVSATKQIIALHIKSAIPLQAQPQAPNNTNTNNNNNNNNNSTPNMETSSIHNKELPKNSYDTITVWVPSKTKQANGTKKKQKKTRNEQQEQSISASSVVLEEKQENKKWEQKAYREYEYDKILNNLLPSDIRVIGWCPVSEEFSARFSTTCRTYRYFFVPNQATMDLDKINTALSYLEGKHDFRNFCKMNAVEVSNYVREIYSAKVKTLHYTSDHDDETPTTHKSDPKQHEHKTDGYHYFEIVGQAFLWHQIRCIVSILFMIGERKNNESPNIILDMFDVQKYPGKPNYSFAPERPLVLYDCYYKNLNRFHCTPENLFNIHCSLLKQYEHSIIELGKICNIMNLIKGSCHVTDKQIIAYIQHKHIALRKKNNKRLSTNKSSLIDSRMLLPPQNDTIKQDIMATVTNKGTSNGSGNVQTMDVHDTNGNKDLTTASLAPLVYCTWGDALQVLRKHHISPSSTGPKEILYIPLLERSMGTTYEQKIAAFTAGTGTNEGDTATRKSKSTGGGSGKRRRYEENRKKKQQNSHPDENNEFYQRMAAQGGDIR